MMLYNDSDEQNHENDKSEDYFQIKGTTEEQLLNPISIKNESVITPIVPAKLKSALHF